MRKPKLWVPDGAHGASFKYALARHRWDEPLENARKLAEDSSLEVLCPMIGEVVEWV